MLIDLRCNGVNPPKARKRVDGLANGLSRRWDISEYRRKFMCHCRFLISILGEDEVGMSSAYYHARPSDRLQYASILPTISVSAFPMAA